MGFVPALSPLQPRAPRFRFARWTTRRGSHGAPHLVGHRPWSFVSAEASDAVQGAPVVWDWAPRPDWAAAPVGGGMGSAGSERALVFVLGDHGA